MRILLTGGSGFVGSHVLRRLLAGGHDVTVLVQPATTLERIEGKLDDIGILTADMCDISAISPVVKKFRPEVCIHLAWYAEPGKYLNSEKNIDSLNGSLSLLRELIRVGCGYFVGAGTCAEYETETGGELLQEDSKVNPASLYAAAKCSFQMLGQQLTTAAGIGFAWGRIFYPYGPYEDQKRLVPALIQSLRNGKIFPATKGQQIRDYIYVEDVASAFVTLAESRTQGIFNISSGQPLSIRQLMQSVTEILGRDGLIEFGKLPYRDWEPMFICGDNQRLRSLGWRPQYTLEQGLQKTIEWWNTKNTGGKISQ